MGVKITQPLIYEQADRIIKDLYGPDANFREGQYEAIEATMIKKRVFNPNLKIELGEGELVDA